MIIRDFAYCFRYHLRHAHDKYSCFRYHLSFGGDWINWSKLRCLSVIVWQIQFTFVLTKYAHDNRAQASYFIKRTKEH